MTNSSNQNTSPAAYVEAELRLAGMLDSRMIGLLRAIVQTGSINQAAKQVGLSYKGAWQIIERANNLAPKVLISTATGGSKGGGTSLTAAGQSLLELFTRLELQHSQFLQQLNQTLADDPEMMLLLKRQVIKTSTRNQLFGQITAIQPGAVNAEVFVTLKGGEQVVASVTLASLDELGAGIGGDAVLLINSPDIILVVDDQGSSLVSSRNCLQGSVIRIQHDAVDSEVIIQLPSGETIAATVTRFSAETMAIQCGSKASALFKSNAAILGVMPPSGERSPSP